MWEWLEAAQTLHATLAILLAIGFSRFLIRSRFWFPRYVHYLGALGLAVGLACWAFMPPEAPINQGSWGGLKSALLVLVVPGLVYFFFVFYGGQREAYERAHPESLVQCRYCREGDVAPGAHCPTCGQTVGQ
jgi:hypothetical protein